jgi:uncharacterized membrane protein HdeD (DUF308 family)
MADWRRRWVHVVWGTLGLLLFLSVFLSENVATTVIGLSMTAASASAFLTSCRNDNKVKRVLEVVSGTVALGDLFLGIYLLEASFPES